MKKIFYLIAMLSVALFAIGCDDRETDEMMAQKTLQVISSDIVFQCTGGSGSVVVDAPSSVSAVSSAPWCTVSVSGNTINVSASEYEGLENRYSEIVITSGGQSTKVTAHQYGRYYQAEIPGTLHFEDEGGQLDILVLHKNYDPEMSSGADWLTVNQLGDYLVIRCLPNTTGNMRFGAITVGPSTINVSQYSLETSILGDYTWYGNTSATNAVVDSMHVHLTNYNESASTITMTIDELGERSLDIPFDINSLTFNLVGGQLWGTTTYQNTEAFIFSMHYYLNASGSGYVTWGSTYQYNCTIRYDEATGKNVVDMEGTGAAAGNSVVAFYFELYKADTASSANRWKVYTAKRLFHPYMAKP